jgi:hypothetical protein
MKIMASTFNRIKNCPGSLFLEKAIDPKLIYKAYSDKATFGSMCHSVAENVLLGNGTLVQNLKSEGFIKGSEIYDKAKYTVNEYVKYIRKIMKKSDNYYIEGKDKFTYKKIIWVAKADFHSVAYDLKTGGYIIDIADLKTGSWDYSESGGDQLYFTALLRCYKSILNYPLKIRTHIVQPNFYGQKIAMQGIIFNNREDVLNQMNSIISSVQTEVYESGNHCTFCPALLQCPHARHLQTTTNALIQEQGYNLDNLTPERLEEIYDKKDLIMSFYKSLEGLILERLKAGEPVGNLSLGYSSGHRKWKDEKKVEKKLKHLGEKRYNKKLKTPAQMEKIAGKENISSLYEQPKIPKIKKIDLLFEEVE